jgi:hypothetical protein
MRRAIFGGLLWLVSALLQLGPAAQAAELKQGTLSLSGNSNISFNSSDPETSPSRQSYSLSVRPGYFMIDNLELALQFSGTIYDSDYGTSNYYAVTPLIIYHMPISEAVNLFGGLGAGYSWSRSSIEGYGGLPGIVDKSRGNRYDGLVGWEYFFSSHVALNLQIDVNRTVYRHYGYNSRSTDVSTQLGFGLYF